MTLPAGACLRPYEIVSSLGAGGMREVYEARDIREAHELIRTGVLMSSRRQYATASDGQRFLLDVAPHRSNPTAPNMVLNRQPSIVR